MRRIITLVMGCAFAGTMLGQEGVATLQDSAVVKEGATKRTNIGYTLSAEAAVGSGDWTAYQIVTNRHSVLGTRSNTGYMRVGMDIEHAFSKKYVLSGVVDGMGSVHADHKFYLQQAYVNMKLNHFFVEVGSREINPVLRDPELSSGAFVESGNAKPMPQVRIGTDGFWTVPYTKKWLEVYFDFAYGKNMDNDYQEDWANSQLAANPGGTYTYYTGEWVHHKQLYLRSNSKKRIFVTIGIDHVAVFGGKVHQLTSAGDKVTEDMGPKLKEFFKVIIPSGGSAYESEHDGSQWIIGNHLGSMTYSIGWNINENHQLVGYLDNIFDDGSGIRKCNGWDGLWGLEYHNKKGGTQVFRDVVVEYFQSTHQSGYIHWDWQDEAEPYRSIEGMKELVVGNDNYYNNGYQGPYTHFGVGRGNALITSPIYTGSQSFIDNSVRAWHVGVKGDISKSERWGNFTYLFRGSYRVGKGTHGAPLREHSHNFGAMFRACWTKGPWTATAAYGLDAGNTYGNNNTFDFTIAYHGKIL